MIKWFIRMLPLLYMGMIWQMSAKFDPGDTAGINLAEIFKYISLPVFGQEGNEVPQLDLEMIYEAGHLIEFGILYVLLAMAYLTFRKLTLTVELVLVFIAVSYGLLDEIHQSFVPYRSTTVNDFVKDTIGVIAAFLIMHSLYYRKKRSGFVNFLHSFHPSGEEREV